MKSQSDINSSSFEEVETHGPCCQLGRSGGVTVAGKQEFSPSTFPPTSSSATLIPHIYFKLSTYFPLNTFPPHTLLGVILLFETLSPNQRGGSQNSQPYQGSYLLWGEHITMLFHSRKIQHRTELKYQMLITIVNNNYSVRLLLFLS